MPGWTLVADAPPDWLLALSSGVTIVAECLLPAAGPATRGAGKAKAAPAAAPVKATVAEEVLRPA